MSVAPYKGPITWRISAALAEITARLARLSVQIPLLRILRVHEESFSPAK